MTVRSFVKLLVLLAIVAGAAYVLNQKPDDRSKTGGLALGDRLFAALDVNDVTGITVASRDATVRVSQAEADWVVESLHRYPANFAAVAGFLRKLDELEVGQVVREGEAMLSEFGLDAASPGPDFLSITFDRKNGTDPVVMELGAIKEPRGGAGMGMGPPRGRYIRVGGGPVVLVDETFSGVATSGEEWIDRNLLQLPLEDIVSVSVQATGTAYVLTRDAARNLVMEGLGEGEKVDQSVALRILQGVQFLRFDTISDPATSDEASGISGYETVTFVLTNGISYELKLALTDASASIRPLRIKAADTSEGQVHAAVVGTFNARHAAWLYQMPAAVLGQLTPARESLVTKAETVVNEPAGETPPAEDTTGQVPPSEVPAEEHAQEVKDPPSPAD